MAFRPDWGIRILEARKAHGLSQSQLARRIDVGFIAVSRWERGVAIPKDIYRVRMAKVFDTTVADMFPYPDNINGDIEAA